MPGILKRLGGLGTKVIRKGLELGRQLGEILHLVQPIAPEIDPMAAARDMGRVSTADALTPEVVALRPDEFVPHDLFVVSDIPWADKYAYEMSIFGRDRATGRFRRQKFDMTVSREMTIQEAQDEARHRFGGYEGSQFSEVWSVKVTGAWKSAEIEW